MRPTMRVLEMVGSELVTTPTVSIPARSRIAASSACSESVPQKPAENGLAAEACEIHGHVGGSASPLIAPRVTKHGNGGLGRDALDVAVDVAVEHDIADNEHLEL